MTKLNLLIVLLGTIFLYRVNYSIKGDGHTIYIPAQTSQEARQTVEMMFPGSLVTGVFRK